MFKPLLKTMPTISGNVKIACDLTDYNKISDNTYECYVREAKLCPVSSILAHKNIRINLSSSRYEYDIKKFYPYYQDIFFESTFSFNKHDYVKIDYTTEPKPRDNDFDFGCKRLSYLKYFKQFGFFAPIYIESADDIPDFFRIHIEIYTSSYNIHKYINVNINTNNDNKSNYLYKYINRYANNIDSNVIYCLPDTSQIMYFGINVVSGGFTKITDNRCQKMFKSQQTINNFDALLTYGFKRNYIVIKQILPLSFYFNINDILTKTEISNYKNCKVKITGKWYKNNEEISLYNFNDDYTKFQQSILTVNKLSGELKYENGAGNIMDFPYPALNEVRYINYKYTNKLTKEYFRWKLKYSSDEHPYITNMNWAFSHNQYGSTRYGEFPGQISLLSGIANIIEDNNKTKHYNLVIPVSHASKYYPYNAQPILVKKYNTQLNNYVSNWFQCINEFDDIYKDDIEWTDVIDNKVYHRGILYNLNNIYNKCDSANLKKIDKFAVFVNLNTDIIDRDNVNNYIYANKSALSNTTYIFDANCNPNVNLADNILATGQINDTQISYSLLKLTSTETSYYDSIAEGLMFNYCGYTAQGAFIDPLNYGIDYYDINRYYNKNELLAYNCKAITNLFNNSYISEAEMYNYKSVEGFELLPINNFNKLIKYGKTEEGLVNSYGYIFVMERENVRNLSVSNSSLFDLIYFSEKCNGSANNKTVYTTDLINDLTNNYNTSTENYNVEMYVKQNFVSYEMLCKLVELSNTPIQTLTDALSNIQQYEYNPLYSVQNETIAKNVFVKLNKVSDKFYGDYIPEDKAAIDNQVIYVDPYNINCIVNKYNSLHRYTNIPFSYYYDASDIPTYSAAAGGNVVSLNDVNSTVLFAKILNQEFVNYFMSNIYNNSDNSLRNDVYDEDNVSEYNVLDNIFIKRRMLYTRNVNAEGIFEIKDLYTPLSYYFTTTYELLKNTSYIRASLLEIVGSAIAQSETAKYNNEYYSTYWKFNPDMPSEIANRFANDGWNINIDTFELFYKKRFLKVDENLFDLIHVIDNSRSDNINAKYKDLYLYRNYDALYDNANVKMQYYHNPTNYDTFGKAIQSVKYNYQPTGCNKELTTFAYVADIGTSLLPLFNNTMIQAMENTIFYQEYGLDNISCCYTINNGEDCTFYRYGKYDKEFMVDISDKYKYSDKLAEEQLYTINNEDYCSYNFAYTYLNDKGLDWLDYVKTHMTSDNSTFYIDYNGTRYKTLCTYHMYDPLYAYVGFEDESTSVVSYMTGYELYTNGKLNSQIKTVAYSYNYSYSYVYTYQIAYTYAYAEGNDDILHYKTTYITYYDNAIGTGTKTGYKDVMYGYYVINVNVSNSTTAIKCTATNGQQIKYITYINGKNITNVPEEGNDDALDGEEYFTSMFKYLVPFAQISLYNTLCEATNTIVKPARYIIDNHYMQTKTSYTDNIYNINYYQKKLNQSILNRYLDDIVPYLTPMVTLNNTYTLKYKNFNGTPDIKTYETVMNNTDYNIYNYNPIIINNINNNVTTWEPLEHKYFNDNKFINLEEEISIEAHKNIIYSEVLYYENSDESLTLFTNYINNKHTYSSNEILFLYNKYDVKYDTIPTGLNASLNEVVYTLIYKFILL